jgi:hypothetical protein
MLPRCFVFCTLLLAPSLPAVGQSATDLRHLGKNIVVAPEQRFRNASCFLCSVDIEGRTTGSVRVFAGNAFLNGSVAGNVFALGGNVTLTGDAQVGGHVVIIGGHLHEDSAANSPARTVIPPIIFVPLILIICVTIGGLIVLTRRMVRDPMAYPPFPRL